MNSVPRPLEQNPLSLAVAVLILFLGLVLAGCGGGGGGGGGGGNGAAPPVAEPVVIPNLPQTRGSPESIANEPEFRTARVLSHIGAEHAYARGGTGEGIVVAVIDSGFDTDHPELRGRIHSKSTNIVDDAFDITTAASHGTAVAGVIAGARNSIGIHGVAFSATILALRDSITDEERMIITSGFTAADLTIDDEFYASVYANGINYAVSVGAHIINLGRIGFPSNEETTEETKDRFEAALSVAAGEGVIMVAPTGNGDGDSGLPPPASYATEPYLDGLMIAVSGVCHKTICPSLVTNPDYIKSDDGEYVSIWTPCGFAENFCLVAPAGFVTLIRAGDPDGDDVFPAGGTSFSSPQVAGAVALLLQMFPVLQENPQHLTKLLRDTATHLGPATVFGAGLLNLEEAVKPQSITVVPISHGREIHLRNARFAPGPAFGNGLSDKHLWQAIFLDAYERAFPIDLSPRVQPATRTLEPQMLFAPATQRQVFHWGDSAMSLHISIDNGDDEEQVFAAGNMFDDQNPTDADWAASFSWQASDSTALRLAKNGSSAGLLGAGTTTGTGFALGNEILTPIFGLAAAEQGVAVEHAFGDANYFTFGYAREDAGDWMAAMQLRREFSGGGALAAAAGLFQEHAALLGGEAEGVLGVDGAATRFLTLSGELPLTDSVGLFAAATRAITRADSDAASVFSDWGTIESDSFGVGVSAGNLTKRDDRLQLLIGSPLRVNDAPVTITTPIAQDANGVITFQSQRTNAAPSGRELDIEVSYSRRLSDNADLSVWSALRLQPGHDDGAASEYLAGVKFSRKF